MDDTTTNLRTDRLVLRPVAESDAERILEYRNRPDVTRWLIRTVVDPDHSGRGYASEAVAAVVDHSFRRLGVRRITAGCFADNAASVRILEKVGMRREQHGVGDSWHAELGWLDGYTYALLEDEWRADRARLRD